MATLRDIDERYHSLLELGANGILDEQTFQDTLEGIEGERIDKMNACVSVLLQLMADETAIKDEIDRLTARRKSAASNIQWLKHWLLNFGGITKGHSAKLDLATLSYRTSEYVEIVNKDIPEEYLLPVEPVERKPDKKKIKDEIKSGNKLIFAIISERPWLAVR